MPRTFSYNEAVRLLGGQESAVVRAIDRVSGPLMLGLGVSGVQEILSWFDPRAEFVRASHQLVADLRARVSPARGRDRTEILAAAHSILVITAYFDAFESAELPFNPRRLKLARADQLTLITGEVIESTSARELLDGLLRADLPLPAPYEPREAIRDRLQELYTRLSASLNAFLTGLALWDGLDQTSRDRLGRNLREIPERAVRRYTELLREAAAECPELLVWAGFDDHEATRWTVRSGLARMERLLTEHSVQAEQTGALASLARGYRAALTKPIVEADGVSIPDRSTVAVSTSPRTNWTRTCAPCRTAPGPNPRGPPISTSG